MQVLQRNSICGIPGNLEFDAYRGTMRIGIIYTHSKSFKPGQQHGGYLGLILTTSQLPLVQMSCSARLDRRGCTLPDAQNEI